MIKFLHPEYYINLSNFYIEKTFLLLKNRKNEIEVFNVFVLISSFTFWTKSDSTKFEALESPDLSNFFLQNLIKKKFSFFINLLFLFNTYNLYENPRHKFKLIGNR